VLVGAGDAADYADTSALRRAVAAEAGVEPEYVSVLIQAGSVLLAVTISVPSPLSPTAVQAALQTSLGTATLASAALGITVEQAPQISVAAPPPPRVPSGSPGMPPAPPGSIHMCEEDCASNPALSGDGICSDGGPGSEYLWCEEGHDCADCGVRAFYPPSPPPPSPSPPPPSPLPSPPPPLPAAPPSEAAASPLSPPPATSASTGAIIGGVVGGITALLLLLVGVVLMMKRGRAVKTDPGNSRVNA